MSPRSEVDASTFNSQLTLPECILQKHSEHATNASLQCIAAQAWTAASEFAQSAKQRLNELMLVSMDEPPLGLHRVRLYRDGSLKVDSNEGTLRRSADGNLITMNPASGGFVAWDLIHNDLNVTYPDGFKKTYPLADRERQILSTTPQMLSIEVQWLPTDVDGTHHFEWNVNQLQNKGDTFRPW